MNIELAKTAMRSIRIAMAYANLSHTVYTPYIAANYGSYYARGFGLTIV